MICLSIVWFVTRHREPSGYERCDDPIGEETIDISGDGLSQQVCFVPDSLLTNSLISSRRFSFCSLRFTSKSFFTWLLVGTYYMDSSSISLFDFFMFLPFSSNFLDGEEFLSLTVGDLDLAFWERRLLVVTSFDFLAFGLFLASCNMLICFIYLSFVLILPWVELSVLIASVNVPLRDDYSPSIEIAPYYHDPHIRHQIVDPKIYSQDVENYGSFFNFLTKVW